MPASFARPWLGGSSWVIGSARVAGRWPWRRRVAGRAQAVPRRARPARRGECGGPRCGFELAVPAGWVGWVEPGNPAEGGDSW
jgi:hypothetical protein